jgi:hypothetical protein
MPLPPFGYGVANYEKNDRFRVILHETIDSMHEKVAERVLDLSGLNSQVRIGSLRSGDVI